MIYSVNSTLIKLVTYTHLLHWKLSLCVIVIILLIHSREFIKDQGVKKVIIKSTMMVMNPNLQAQQLIQQQYHRQNVQLTPVNVSLKPLPFFDTHGCLVQPTALASRGSSRFQTASFQFTLSLDQANDIASNRDLRQTAKISHLYQIQLRFCPLDTTKEQTDEFPPSICVEVNNKMCPLPNPIPPTNPTLNPSDLPNPQTSLRFVNCLQLFPTTLTSSGLQITARQGSLRC